MMIIQKNLKKASHPYYDGYIDLQNLCLRILRFDEIMFGEGNDDFYGILFDGAWLWEEYCNSILRKFGFIHPENKKGTGSLSLFTNGTGRRYPDFYNSNAVIDAKYKRYEGKHVSEAGRDDLHQIISYMYIRKASCGAFLSPFSFPVANITNSLLNGYGGRISLLGIEIPRNTTSYSYFCDEMRKSEDKFTTILKDFISCASD